MLHHHRIGGVSNPKPVGHPKHMTVHWEAGHTQGVAKNDIGGLPTDAGQRNQGIEIRGDLPSMPLDNGARHSDERASLGAKKTGRPNQGFQVFWFDQRHCTRIRIAPEQLRRHLVHPFIGALRGQHRGTQQLECVAKDQLR
jgi:hypothetical protein